MRIIYSIIIALFVGNTYLPGQSSSGTDRSSDVPTIFLISEDDTAYGNLVENTPNSLLDVCGDAMDVAYKKWIFMLADMEDFAVQQSFEIRGLKIWMNVFWNADGSIDHIVYYPKPNSKNIDYSEFTTFLNKFAASYRLDVDADISFAHYGSASFPTFVEQMFPDRKDK